MTTRILTIDKNETIKNNLECLLTHLGYYNILASTEHEAVSKAYLDKPDLIICTDETGGINLSSFLKQMSQDAVTKKIPVVMLPFSLCQYLQFQDFYSECAQLIATIVHRNLLRRTKSSAPKGIDKADSDYSSCCAA